MIRLVTQALMNVYQVQTFEYRVDQAFLGHSSRPPKAHASLTGRARSEPSSNYKREAA